MQGNRRMEAVSGAAPMIMGAILHPVYVPSGQRAVSRHSHAGSSRTRRDFTRAAIRVMT